MAPTTPRAIVVLFFVVEELSCEAVEDAEGAFDVEEYTVPDDRQLVSSEAPEILISDEPPEDY